MNKGNEYVVYAGPFNFPDGGAAARRIYANCQTFREVGYDVVVLSGQLSTQSISYYNGIKIISLNERLYEGLPRYLKHFMYFSAGEKAVEWLDSQEVKPVAVVVYSGYSPYLLRLIPWCRKNSVKIIFDAVEWYDAPNSILQYLLPYYLNIEFAMRFLLHKCDGLILISSYLKKYYDKGSSIKILVPPTIDCDNTTYRLDCKKSGVTKFVYAGTPGKKDSIELIVRSICSAKDQGFNVKLDLAGVTFEQLEKYPKVRELDKKTLNEVVRCHGYVSHNLALNLVRESDFSIIIRPNIRSVEAGFPTKFVESLAVGTPVIANLTSDLGAYLTDGFNGYVLDIGKENDIYRCIESACMLGKSKLYDMRVNARNTAVSCFDYKIFTSSFGEILNN